MSFFDDLPEPPERPRQPQPLRPGWAGPPSDELPGVVHIGEFIHSGPQLVMALKSVEVFSTGCVLNLVWSMRRSNESEREWRDAADQALNYPRTGLEIDSGLRIGAALADGRRAIAAHNSPTFEEDQEGVTGPVLTVLGGGGSSASGEQVESTGRYWLWPLPLEGDTRLIAKWDAIGLPESSVVISAEQLGQALGKVRRYWSD